MSKSLLVVAVLALSACASIPEDFEQTPSQAWHAPAETTLGAFLEPYLAANPGQSGVWLLSDPRDAFRVRYAAAARAERTLDMQYYLWKGDVTGRLLLWRALEAADRGVRVRILLDDIFHKGRDQDYLAIDAHPNVEFRVFNPIGSRGAGRNLNFAVNKKHLNHRMHNKIFLVDNTAAVLGGRNIGDDYFGIDPELNFHDLDVFVVGPAAQEAGAAFDMYWNSRAAVPISVLTGRPGEAAELDLLRLNNEEEIMDAIGQIPYSLPASHEDMLAQWREGMERATWGDASVVVDPLERFDGDTESIFVELGADLVAAMDSDLVIQTAYLIPSDEGLAHLKELTDQGVRVRILTNSLLSNNHISVHAHYMKYRKRLLEAGVELYELRADAALLEHYKETDSRIADSHAGLHTKAFVVDREISMIGSYNMDPRSRVWNSEIGLVITSPEFAELVLEEMLEEFEPTNSYRLSLNEKDKLIWTITNEDGSVETWTHDPDASIWRRMGARFISWIPIENEL